MTTDDAAPKAAWPALSTAAVERGVTDIPNPSPNTPRAVAASPIVVAGVQRDIATSAPDYEPLPFYSSDTDMETDLDLAAWLADTSAPAPEGLSVSGFGAVIGDPAAAEAAVEAPATDFDANLGDATAS